MHIYSFLFFLLIKRVLYAIRDLDSYIYPFTNYRLVSFFYAASSSLDFRRNSVNSSFILFFKIIL